MYLRLLYIIDYYIVKVISLFFVFMEIESVIGGHYMNHEPYHYKLIKKSYKRHNKDIHLHYIKSL